MSKRPPRKIFLESTALFQLGPRLDNLYLSQLLATRESIPFDILIAEVSWMEYLRDRKREIRKCIERLRPITNELSNHGVTLDKVDEAEQALCGYMDRIEEQFAKKAEVAGFHIVPMPDGLDLRRLLEMSIECTPPFEEPEAKSKEKGFRDSLIMFTILESIRGGTLDEAVLITGDNLLGEGISLHAREFETKIRVLPDLAAAVEFLEARMDEQNRGRVRAEAAEAKAILEGFRDRLEARVREIRDLDDSDLGQSGPFIEHQENDAFNSTLGFLFKSPRDYVDIQRINSISFDHVETAVWKEKQEGGGIHPVHDCLQGPCGGIRASFGHIQFHQEIRGGRSRQALGRHNAHECTDTDYGKGS